MGTKAPQRISIGGRIIGAGRPALIVAELSANHNLDFNIAVKTLKAMKAAGADAVKIQTYTPDTITIDCASPRFRIGHGTLWDGQTLYELYKKAYTPWDWQPKLKKLAVVFIMMLMHFQVKQQVLIAKEEEY